MRVQAVMFIILLFCSTCYASNDYVIRTILQESVSEGYEGMLAVSCVIRNRVNNKRWPDTPEKVCAQKYQFSCNNKDNWDKFKKYINKNDKLLARKAWYDSNFKSNVGKATHYHSVKVNPRWTSKMEYIKQIGNHKFYYEN